jgi:hypothetical protein
LCALAQSWRAVGSCCASLWSHLQPDFMSETDSLTMGIAMNSTMNWVDYIHEALKKLRNKSVRTLLADELFSEERTRIVIKVRAHHYFEIFPWFLTPTEEGHRYRQSLNLKKNSNVAHELLSAINFFWERNFSDDEFRLIAECYLKLERPVHCLSPIIQLKNDIEKTLLSNVSGNSDWIMDVFLDYPH